MSDISVFRRKSEQFILLGVKSMDYPDNKMRQLSVVKVP